MKNHKCKLCNKTYPTIEMSKWANVCYHCLIASDETWYSDDEILDMKADNSYNSIIRDMREIVK